MHATYISIDDSKGPDDVPCVQVRTWYKNQLQRLRGCLAFGRMIGAIVALLVYVFFLQQAGGFVARHVPRRIFRRL